MLEDGLAHVENFDGDELVMFSEIKPEQEQLTQLPEDELVKMETNNDIPLNFRFIQVNDDGEEVELVKMEDNRQIPHNFSFAQTKDDVELVKMETPEAVPLNFRF